MIQYKRADLVSAELVFQAFTDGFSDYPIKLAMTLEQFDSRFFGPEGNSRAYSYVAFDAEKPVGVILGGIRHWDGLKTLRCGTLCLHPDYRGQGIAQALFERHEQVAVDENCDRMSLEVLKMNERAIHFYEKLDYFKAYDLKYYNLPLVTSEGQVLPQPQFSTPDNTADALVFTPVDFQTLEAARQSLVGVHIHWQGETDYYKEATGDYHFKIEVQGNVVGWLSFSPTGKLNLLWIAPTERMKGYGRAAVAKAAAVTGAKQLSAALVNNGLLEGFLRKMNFQKDTIEQFEMFKLMN